MLTFHENKFKVAAKLLPIFHKWRGNGCEKVLFRVIHFSIDVLSYIELYRCHKQAHVLLTYLILALPRIIGTLNTKAKKVNNSKRNSTQFFAYRVTLCYRFFFFLRFHMQHTFYVCKRNAANAENASRIKYIHFFHFVCIFQVVLCKRIFTRVWMKQHIEK